METLLLAIVAAPGIVFLGLALVWLLGWTPGERFVARLTALVYAATTIGALSIAWMMYSAGLSSLRVPLGTWLEAGDYTFVLSLLIDPLSGVLVTLTNILIGIVGVFSVRYLHRDRGYFRFFLLLHLFAFGASLAFAASSFDLLLGGWELVGVTSVLLVGFFDERREPVANAIRVFAFYRIADLGLLIAIFLIHTLTNTAQFETLFVGVWPMQTTPLSPDASLWIALLLLISASGKSAQAPFSGWLPRAMEGPTPSSAIFYGAISVHLGAYLLLRNEPVIRSAPFAAAAVVAVGAITAFLATLVHRVSIDAKTSLAYAGMAQVGIIFVEIGLGFPRLALAHLAGHAVVRTLQFLRAPSMLHDYHRVHAAAGGQLGRTGAHYEHLVPAPIRSFLYHAAMERGYYDALLDRLVTGPVLRFARLLASLEPGARPLQPPKNAPLPLTSRSSTSPATARELAERVPR